MPQLDTASSWAPPSSSIKVSAASAATAGSFAVSLSAAPGTSSLASAIAQAADIALASAASCTRLPVGVKSLPNTLKHSALP